jgi:arylsulfatase A-like enzyme/Flp pilus assembly protein TadD
MRRISRAALLLAGLASACHHRPSPRPNVVLISIDTLRADRLGCYGDANAETPTIDALARQGTLFRHAYSPLPLTLPAHTTMLTGLEPASHRLLDNGLTAADLGVPTLAERLQSAGYDTAAFVAAFILNRVYGLDRGFNVYDDGPPSETEIRGLFRGVADARERLDASIAWLGRPREKPFFLFLHLYDVHWPHEAPGPFASRFAARPYDGEVAYVDSQVRRLLDVLDTRGLAASTLVILTADHGESLGEHGEASHGIFLYDATLHVPLILRLPGTIAAGRVVDDPVGLVDVTPTVLQLLGLPPSSPSQGRAQLGASGGGKERVLWAQSDHPALHYGWAPLRSVRQERWKYIDAPRPELYDTSSDPAETKDLASQQPAVVARMSSLLKTVEAELARVRPAAAPKGPDEETRARLAALGYAADPAPPGPALDPKDGIASIRGLDDVTPTLVSGHPDLVRAADRYRELTKEFPRHGPWFLALGRTLEMLGQYKEAEAAYRDALRREGVQVLTLPRLAVLAAWRGDTEADLAACRRLVEIVPRHAASRRLLGEALERAGRDAEAEAAYRESLRLDPSSRSARVSWCRFLIARGRQAEAEPVRLELAREQPADPETLAVEGLALQAEGRLPQAIERLDAAVEARPDEARFLADRGLARLQAGDARGARSDLEGALAIWPGYARAKEGLKRARGAGTVRAARGSPPRS